MKIEFTLKIISRESGVGRESTQDDRRLRVVYHIERFIKYNQVRRGTRPPPVRTYLSLSILETNLYSTTKGMFIIYKSFKYTRGVYTKRSFNDVQREASQLSVASSSSCLLGYQRSPSGRSGRPVCRAVAGMSRAFSRTSVFGANSFTTAVPDVDAPGSTAELFLRNTSMALPSALASTTDPEGLSQTTAAASPGACFESGAKVTLVFLGSFSIFFVARVWCLRVNQVVPESKGLSRSEEASKLLDLMSAKRLVRSGLPQRSISVAEEVSALSIRCRSVSVQTTPAPVRGGIGGGGGISEARRRAGIGGNGDPTKSECLRPRFVYRTEPPIGERSSSGWTSHTRSLEVFQRRMRTLRA